MYSLMIAAMKRNVIAVDPLPQNLGLIQRSLMESGNGEVLLVNNPIRSISSNHGKD